MSATVERTTFAWRDGKVSGEWHRPANATTVLILGHGAGGDMNHPLLVEVASRLAGTGVAVVRFNFPHREGGRKAPDRQDTLEACYWGVAKAVASSAERLYLGGTSMGGRIASHIVAGGFPAAGLVFQSYPLHPPGKPERLRDAHLTRIAVPMLFVSGTRDSFATRELLEKTVASLPSATLHLIDGADHGLKVRGRPPADVQDEIVSTIGGWIG